MKIAAFLILILSTAIAANAREVILLGAPIKSEVAPRLAVSAGGALTLDVIIPASLGKTDLVFGLWQISGGITLPLGETRKVTARPDAHGITSLRANFPNLERKTSVLVKFAATDAPDVTLGLAHVQVYPPIDWAPIARKIKQDGPRVLVFGRDSALLNFLKAREIECVEGGEDPPERLDRDILALGSLSSQEWTERKDQIASDGGRLLVFVSDSDQLPGVYTQPLGEGAVTKITLPVLATLASDPRSEDLLFQLIEQHLHPASGAAPEKSL